MKSFELGWAADGGLGFPIEVDLGRLIETRLLIQANSGSGKSFTLRRILEQTYGHVQQLVIDVEDEFYTLRERFDYVLAGRAGGDCPAEPRSADLLARRLLELGTSAILGIYELKAHERIRFVRVFLDALVNAPKDLWHPVLVVVDEAHIFCPEAGQAESASAVIDLMTRGRKRGFCGVLATQRISKLHKDAAAEANNKLIGRSALDVDMKRSGDELGMPKNERASLRTLQPGHFFAFGPAVSDVVVEMTVGKVTTTHPKAGDRSAPAPAPGEKVRKVLAALADLPAQAEEEVRTLAEAKKRIAQLERAAKATPAAPAAPALKEVAVVKPAELRRLEGLLARADKTVAAIGKLIEGAQGFREAFEDGGRALRDSIAKAYDSNKREGAVVAQGRSALAPAAAAPHVSRAPIAARRPTPTAEGDVVAQTRMGRAFLTVLAQHQAKGPMTKRRLHILAGYALGGATSRCFADLAGAGLVTNAGPRQLAITEAGLVALGPWDPLPTGRALRDEVLAKLGPMERAFLGQLFAAFPKSVSKADLHERTGYSVGGATSRAFAYLVGCGYADNAGPRQLVASLDFFGE